MRLTPYAAAITLIACASAQAGEFIPLQTELGQATKFSQNGEYLSIFVNGSGGARWIRATGAEEPISGLNSLNGINNLGTVSGSVPVGGGADNGGTDVPALSALGATAPTEMPLPADTQNADVYDVSDDGSAVGLTWATDWSVARAYYFSASQNAIAVLPVDDPDEGSRGNSISADGSVIAGWNDDPTTGFRRGVVWIGLVPTYPTATIGADTYNVGEASAVSGNGQWVVGSNYPSDTGAASWRLNVQTGELTEIPVMPFAFGISDDGKTVVGASGFFDVPPRAAYIWTEEGGSQLLTDYMTAKGIEYPSDWGFEGGLTAISGDGDTVAGWTRVSPNGLQSFIVTGISAPADSIFKDGFDGAPPLNPVLDSGFEQSLGGSGPWASTSTNFGVALCSISMCGDGGGSAGAHSGSAWAWFGGAEEAAEESTVSQSVTIPAGGPQYLNFWLWIGAVNGSDSVLTVSVDGTEVASYPEPPEAEAGYTQRSVDISAYADGAAHTIEFRYSETAGIMSNYSLDDVTIDATQPTLRAPVRASKTPDAATATRKRH
ncbi:hypothetical protein [Dokdonella sp.]|uniref:hypothetical protein n=1 Tax=Dokdonella sp. TaxID=2291710 RepID=UPI001B02AE8F|nr:hypothetical protein [Dokdonella sp.]MBO9662663.1 hypothetical protein [Dokdonella sp.]